MVAPPCAQVQFLIIFNKTPTYVIGANLNRVVYGLEIMVAYLAHDRHIYKRIKK